MHYICDNYKEIKLQGWRVSLKNYQFVSLFFFAPNLHADDRKNMKLVLWVEAINANIKCEN